VIYFFIGKSNTGKSVKAEELAMTFDLPNKLYVATMKVMDEDGEVRVQKHRKQREGKGFETLEVPLNITEIIPQIKEPEKTVVLLECISNLVGNEMYDNPERSVLDEALLAEEIARDIRLLADSTAELIVVSSVYDAKEEYSEETLKYIRYLDRTNEAIKQIADKVIEIGI
jgi:adenosylcobinamide kinase/adenosylcobinamide-phosphate guanylyltransferase